MMCRCLLLLLLVLGIVGGPARAADPISREQALRNLANGEAVVRRAAVIRLAEIGRGEDAKQLLPRLKDQDLEVRSAAEAALWAVWSRSGDAKVDALLAQGTLAMNARQFDLALAAFNEVIRLKPGFAEGWNKRATLYFMAGETRLSMNDCREVLKRNPSHFGALSGFGLLYLQLEEPQKALGYFERAYAINPGMQGAAANIEAIRRYMGRRQQRTA